MKQLTERRLPRLGIVAIATVAMVLPIALFAPLEVSDWPYWAALALIGATGIGLMFRARFARVLGSVGALACLVLGPRALYQTLGGLDGVEAWDLALVLATANAVATTVLGCWLALRTALVLADRAGASAITPRLVGGVLAIVAIDHLWLAYSIGFDLHGSWSMTASSQGIQLLGFPGWPIWHAALLLVSLAMAFGPRVVVEKATTGLMILAFALVPLAIAMMVTAGGLMAELFAFITATTLLAAYLAWWLRDESRPGLITPA